MAYELCQTNTGAAGNSGSGYYQVLGNCLCFTFLTFSVNDINLSPEDLNPSVSVNPDNSNNSFNILTFFAFSELWYNLVLDGCMIHIDCGLEVVEP